MSRGPRVGPSGVRGVRTDPPSRTPPPAVSRGEGPEVWVYTYLGEDTAAADRDLTSWRSLKRIARQDGGRMFT